MLQAAVSGSDFFELWLTLASLAHSDFRLERGGYV